MHLSRHPTSYPTRYQEIAARLEQELRHHYRCGDYLPAEQQLATRFDVNRHTLRRAIDQLVERGWVQLATVIISPTPRTIFRYPPPSTSPDTLQRWSPSTCRLTI